ncbi:3'(2'),5'-bisphosphate nucleotidase CysQ family protein [Bacillus cereus]|uniref:3'(2'),5'-bisphosphate nucleotidase CysQ family protein n=1 Tax=Bacillus cereus TaxID=1396 RepID=UPI001F0BEE95|nr:inositol monophosphatase family protein [Bacillus cereus]
MFHNIPLTGLLDICIRAGNKVMNIYNSDFRVDMKEDKPPLTLADKKSNMVILEGLKEILPETLILSEESSQVPYHSRKDLDYFWLVDPLDGNKEFVRKNGEFTINIAFIRKNYPVIGVIYSPVLDDFYFAKEGIGAFKLHDVSNGKYTTDLNLINSSKRLSIGRLNEEIVVIASRSHQSKVS